MTSTADVAAKLKELPDGAYVFMVDNQGNPKDPVSNILSVENPDNQFHVKVNASRGYLIFHLSYPVSIFKNLLYSIGPQGFGPKSDELSCV